MTIGRTRFTLTAAAVVIGLSSTMALAQTARGGGGGRGQTPATLGIHGFSVVLVVGGTNAQTDELQAKLVELRAQGYNDRNPRVLELQSQIAQARADLSSAKVRQGAGASENVPAAARKALADMKDFLPYKRYQLLDATWILCCGPDSPIGKSQVSGRVRGPDSRDYLYTVDPGDVVGSKLNLRFVMRELQTVTPVMTGILSDTARLELARAHADVIQELDEARLQLRTMKQRFDVGTATGSEMESATARARRAEQAVRDLGTLLNDDDRRLAQAGLGGRGTSAASGARGGGGTSARGMAEVMDSSFSISPGETVVIGTSRINGDQALIAILTAATKPGGVR